MDIAQLFPAHPVLQDTIQDMQDGSLDPFDRSGSFLHAHGYLQCLQAVSVINEAQYQACRNQLLTIMDGPKW